MQKAEFKNNLQNLVSAKAKQTRIKRLVDWDKSEVQVKKMFIEIANDQVNGEYLIKDEIKHTLSKIIRYFVSADCYNPNKGLFLFGSYGVGKTTIFKIIRKMLAIAGGVQYNVNGFQQVSLEKIISDYKKEGDIRRYSYGLNENPLHLCIDEFGKPINEKIYGTSAIEIINSLMMVRYEILSFGYVTHATSNFAPDQLDLPESIMDRMKEMFNFISIDGNSYR